MPANSLRMLLALTLTVLSPGMVQASAGSNPHEVMMLRDPRLGPGVGLNRLDSLDQQSQSYTGVVTDNNKSLLLLSVVSVNRAAGLVVFGKWP